MCLFVACDSKTPIPEYESKGGKTSNNSQELVLVDQVSVLFDFMLHVTRTGMQVEDMR